MIIVDGDKVVIAEGNRREEYGIGTPEGFRIISQLWLRSGWDAKYVYSFTWLGRPIIQLPEDMFRLQELIYDLRPDVIIETGVAHGGSLVFYASLCKAMGRGRVIGIDIEIRPHNRAAIERHELSSLIELVEADSIAPATISEVRERTRGAQTVLILLDSCHTKDHVLASGWLLGAKYLESRAALVDVQSGEGHIVLFGMRPQFRAQSYQAFKLFFNSLFASVQ